MSDETYGRTRSGYEIDDDLVRRLGEKAEDGVDVEATLRRRGGRPAMGSGPASVESVRLDPELSLALGKRAEDEGRSNSEVIREALRQYLRAS